MDQRKLEVTTEPVGNAVQIDGKTLFTVFSNGSIVPGDITGQDVDAIYERLAVDKNVDDYTRVAIITVAALSAKLRELTEEIAKLQQR